MHTSRRRRRAQQVILSKQQTLVTSAMRLSQEFYLHAVYNYKPTRSALAPIYISQSILSDYAANPFVFGRRGDVNQGRRSRGTSPTQNLE